MYLAAILVTAVVVIVIVVVIILSLWRRRRKGQPKEEKFPLTKSEPFEGTSYKTYKEG